MPITQEPADKVVQRTSWLPAAEQGQADAVAAALDRVLLAPTASNRIAAVAAVEAYLVATEHLWSDESDNAANIAAGPR